MVTSVGPPVSELLRNSRFEILPLDGIEEEVREHLSPDTKVTVTASPRKGLEATLDAQREPRSRGLPGGAAPVGAGSFATAATSRRCSRGSRRRASGSCSSPPATPRTPGEYQGAAELLAAMGDARTRFDRIGITGYPESHHLISDEETIRAMFAKAEMATDIISQLCFDPATIALVDRRGPGARHAAADLDRDAGLRGQQRSSSGSR